MGRRFKGITPFVIHFRVKSRLTDALRRRYTAVQMLAWLGVVGLIISALLLLSSWIAAGDNFARFRRFPIMWLAVSGASVALLALLGSALFFRLHLRAAIVRHLEQDLARRASSRANEAPADQEDITPDPKRPITPTNVHMNFSFTSDYDDERY